MSFTETILTVGGIIFSILVLPTLMDENASIPRKQSLPSSIVLFFFFTIPYAQLGLILPAVSTTLGAVLWGLVAMYRTQNKHEKSNNLESKSCAR